MKSWFFLSILLSFSALAHEKVKLNGKLYVAQGFDDNDSVEITAIGTLPDSCYRNPTFSVEKKGTSYLVRLFAYHIPNGGCRDVAMAYNQTINFGMMPAGDYEVALVGLQATQTEKLRVKPAKTGLKDDFTYGNVTGIVENDANREIELVGVNPVNCMVFDKVQAEVQKNLIVLRPEFKEAGTCQNRKTPFKIKYKVPYLAKAPQGVLLHVRIMNGRAITYFYQNRQ